MVDIVGDDISFFRKGVASILLLLGRLLLAAAVDSMWLDWP